MKIYDLIPTNGRKSFYGKAKVIINDDDSETLISYDTPILTRYKDGTYKKLWHGWTDTTGKHIIAFCGLHKKDFEALD